MKAPLWIAGVLFPFCVLAASGCSSVKVLSKYELTSGNYRVREKGSRFEKAKVVAGGDSIAVFRNGTPVLLKGSDLFFIQNNLDFDIVLAPFKYRPATPSLPRQLTTSFNAHLFGGYRFDRFHVRANNGMVNQKSVAHRSLGIGVFGGISSLVVGPWTTNYRTTDEYNGLGISRGIMLLGGVDSVTFGLALGLDRLTDRDKNIWIYQNKPWYGLTIGLNIN